MANIDADIRVISRILKDDNTRSKTLGITQVGKLSSIVIVADVYGGVWAHEIGHGVGISGDYKDGEHRNRVMWHTNAGAENILELNSECDAYEQ